MRVIGFLEYLLEASIGAAVLIPLVLIARRFFRVRVGSRAIYLAWLLVALRLLIPLSLPNPLLVKEADTSRRAPATESVSGAIPVSMGGAAGQNADIDGGAPLDSVLFDAAWTNGPTTEARKLNTLPAASDVPDMAVRAPLSVEQRLFCMHAAGAASVALYMLIANRRFRRRIVRAQAGGLTGDAQATYEELCRALRMRPLPVAYADPLSGACLVGALRPRIFLPLAMRREDARFTLLHELCHAKAGDGLWGLLRNVCCVLFWFHPLVWLGAHLSRLDAEMACDERVTERLSALERVDYAEMLVRATVGHGTPGIGVLATGMSMNGKRMKARVAGIVRSRGVRRSALAVAALAGVVLLVATFATAEVEPHTLEGIPAHGDSSTGGAALPVADAEGGLVSRMEEQGAPSPSAAQKLKAIEAKASVLEALQLPIEGITVAEGACEIDWKLPESGLARMQIHDANGNVLTDDAVAGGTHRGTYPALYGFAAPWTFTLTGNDLSVTTFSMDAAGAITSYDAGIRPDEALRTEQLFVEGVTEASMFSDAFERNRAIQLARHAGTYYDADGEEARRSLVLRATGSGIAGIGGTDDRCEVYDAFGRVRKYWVISREGEQKHWAFRVQVDPPRILSMQQSIQEADEVREMSAYIVYPTAEEVIADTRSFLKEKAGWSEQDVEAPVLSFVRSEEGARTALYGESAENARDLWHAEYIGVHRHLGDFWRMDVMQDSAEQRPVTEAEQALAARLARELAGNTRTFDYGEVESAEVEAQVHVYGTEEIARVWLGYQHGEHYDRAYVRLNPPAVLALAHDPDVKGTADWPDAEVQPEILSALGLPITGLRLTSSACEMDWKEVSGWTARWADAEGQQFELLEGTRLLGHSTPFDRPAPWTLTIERDGMVLHTLVLSEEAQVLSYAYGGYPDDVALRTQPGLGRSGFEVEPEVLEQLLRAAGAASGQAVGSQFTEVRALAGEVRKYDISTDVGRYCATAQTNGERILSFYLKDGEDAHYMDMIFAPTREEAVELTRTFLIETAGWLPEEVDSPQLAVIDRPFAGERFGYDFYGESEAGAQDLWYGNFLGGWRHLNAFWMQAVLKDAPAARVITEAERADVEAYAREFVEKTREMYTLPKLTAKAEDSVRIYDFGEVVRVDVDGADGVIDTLHVRLTPRSVLYQNRGDSVKKTSP